ncbi:MAG: o-succinylbenzoate synthase [Catalinimonas sp.]
MKLCCDIFPHRLRFRFEAGTSRGVLTEKTTYLLRVRADGRTGWGECGPLRGLSPDDRPDFAAQLQKVCAALASADLGPDEAAARLDALVPPDLPAVRFGVETALADLRRARPFQLFDNAFARGERPLPINGLVWMGPAEVMRQQIDEKLAAGFTCIKMKIGALDFDTEWALLADVRARYSAAQITLRVDANGAFAPDDAPEKLARLAELDLHSIEQPIRAGQWPQMAALCHRSPLPIALDEELIGVTDPARRNQLLDQINPAYIILKPTLVGGIRATHDWIARAEARGIGWWITSALESNVGLNAVAQLTGEYAVTLPQGLGTGQLYHNNVPAPLTIRAGHLHYAPGGPWADPAALPS